MPAVRLWRRPIGERALVTENERVKMRHRIRGILMLRASGDGIANGSLDVAQEILEAVLDQKVEV